MGLGEIVVGPQALLGELRPVTHCKLNEAALQELVDELLAEEDINIVWMPDVVEAAVYRNALGLMIRVAEELLGRCRISLLGSEIAMSLESVASDKAPPEAGAQGGKGTGEPRELRPGSEQSFTPKPPSASVSSQQNLAPDGNSRTKITGGSRRWCCSTSRITRYSSIRQR